MKITKEVREWIILIVVLGGLYLTGWHKHVASFVQRGIVMTGILQPDITETHGQASYALTLEDLNGNRLSMDDLRGRPIFMNVWATWCPPCIAEMPDIQDLHDAMDGEIQFIMLSRDQDEQKAKDWIARKGYDFPVFFARSPIPAELRSQAIPTTFVIDASGNIVVKNSGMSKYNTEKFRGFLRSL